MLKYVVEIEEATGQIIRITFPQRDTPPEGLDEILGTRYVHVTEENLPPGGNDLKYFINEHWWTSEGFIHIGKKPNKHAFWSHESQKWVWDGKKVLSDIREVRNGKLKSSDWTQIPDASLTAEEKQIAREYRQALRDITKDLNSPESHDAIAWPTKPDFI